MSGFFQGYGLVALAVAVALHGQPTPYKYVTKARIVAVVLWPLAIYNIAHTDPETGERIELK